MAQDDQAARGFKVRALGEIAIRCRDMDAMERFYQDVIGLELLAQRDQGITFFKISEGYAGHTSVLALFEPGAGRADLHPQSLEPPETGARSSLHHLALSLGWEEQERAIAWYDHLGQPYRIQQFDWIGWRGVFTSDPDGNTVELVAAAPKGVV
ncbi:MAG: VOC family protein [Rhodobacteraceae bacterium]|nr:VOC family protein [Paracoccaceae bacterium]